MLKLGKETNPLSLLSSVLLRISSLHQEALVAQGQVHLATLKALLSMTDRPVVVERFKKQKGGWSSDFSCWAVGKATLLRLGQCSLINRDSEQDR